MENLKFEVVVFGKVYSCQNEPQVHRFLKSLNRHWDSRAEVRAVDPFGKYVARWLINDYLK